MTYKIPIEEWHVRRIGGRDRLCGNRLDLKGDHVKDHISSPLINQPPLEENGTAVTRNAEYDLRGKMSGDIGTTE